MELGIIIIFNNNENDIDISSCTQHLNALEDVKFCFVNNNSQDLTYNVLEIIRDRCSNVSIVNVKKLKSEKSAVKAGARLMFNQFNLEHIGFVNINNTHNQKNFSGLMASIRDKKIEILKSHQDFLNKKEVKLTQFQRLFSVIDYLEQLKAESEYA